MLGSGTNRVWSGILIVFRFLFLFLALMMNERSRAA